MDIIQQWLKENLSWVFIHYLYLPIVASVFFLKNTESGLLFWIDF